MMKRDISDYENKYLATPFTKINNTYRKRCVKEQLMKYPHDKILEIGCGYYPLFLDVKKEEYSFWKIIEPSDVFEKNARQIINNNGYDSVEVEKVFFEDFIVRDRYDFIICSSLLQEVDNSELILKNIYKLLKKDGVAHINVPNANSFHRLLAIQMGLIDDVFALSERSNLLQQQRVYDMNTLKKEVDHFGLEVIEEGGFFIKPFTHEQMQKMYDECILTDNMIKGLYEMTKYMPEYASEIFVNIKKLS